MTAVSFVGAATGVSGDYGNLTPTIHASATAGDAMLLLATVRNTAAKVATPTGWSVLLTDGNVVLFGRAHSGTESSPTVTFTGGAAGDTVTAQVAVFRGLKLVVRGAISTISNVSAQNVALPATMTPGRGGCLLLAIGWKQDDWTSVATLSGMTEIAETFSTTGNDAGMVWDYQIQTTAAASPAGPFTVTGGASAVSKSYVLALDQAAAIGTTTQDVYPPRVLVAVTNLVIGDDVIVYRVVGGVRTAVRAGSSDAVTDTSFLVTDAEIPFGVSVSYVAVVSGTEYATSPTTYVLPGGKVALSDAITGLAAEVTILAWPERDNDRQATVFKAGGRNIVVSGDWGMYEGTIDLFVLTTSAGDNLRALLKSATQGVLQIRQPGGYDGVDSYLSVTAAAEKRFSQDGSDQRRTWSLTVAETDPWADSEQAHGFTYADLEAAYTGLTYADLAGDYATYLDLAQADLS